jgi:hypothetical protein
MTEHAREMSYTLGASHLMIPITKIAPAHTLEQGLFS